MNHFFNGISLLDWSATAIKQFAFSFLVSIDLLYDLYYNIRPKGTSTRIHKLMHRTTTTKLYYFTKQVN